MTSLGKKEFLEEMDCGANVAYILNDSSSFLSTEYKVMHSQKDSSFIQCTKMLFNGKLQLYYLTKGYKSLMSIMGNIDADTFMTIAESLISDITEVKNNGFLSCQNIDVSFERIYVDTTTYKVKLIYLPLNKKIFDDYSEFENALRSSLVKLISGLHTLSSPKTMRFIADLSNGLLSLEDLYKKIKTNPSSRPFERPAEGIGIEHVELKNSQKLKLVAMDAPARLEITVTKDEFILGKKESAVDGLIDYNKGISRVHCKIVKRTQGYMVVDLQSMNGTYINRERLQPEKEYPVKNGDVVSLANSSFKVEIR